MRTCSTYVVLSRFDELGDAWSLLLVKWFKFACTVIGCCADEFVCAVDECWLLLLLLDEDDDDDDFLLFDFDDGDDDMDFVAVAVAVLGFIWNK